MESSELLPTPPVSRSAELWTSVESSTGGRLSGYFLLIICLASIGGLLFGYDTGVISGVLVLLGEDLGQSLSDFQLEVITSITSAGALFGSLAAGLYADSFGRKTIIAVSCIVFVGDSIFMGLTWSYASLVLGRAIIGLAVGAASTTVPVYIAEIAPASHRGRLVALNSVSTTGGQFLAYVAGSMFSTVPHGWRFMFILASLPPLIFLFLIELIPESPRYSVSRGDLKKAELSISKLYPNAPQQTVRCLVEELSYETQSAYKPISAFKELFTVKSNFRALAVACGLMASQQLCGFNSFMYYSATIFKVLGFHDPITISIAVSATNFLFTWVAVKYIDIVGRRTMLLRTVWIMVIALLVTGWSFDQDGYIVVITTVIFVSSYASALGNVPWQAIEFLPISVRSVGSMMIASTNWLLNSLVSLTFLSSLRVLKPAGIFCIYATFTLLAYIGIYFCYPEVKGMSLEDISQVFENGYMVH